MDSLLLIIIYFLVVFYVLYEMSLSLEDQLEDKVSISVNKKFLVEQTEAQLSSYRDATKHISVEAKEVGFGKNKNLALRLTFDNEVMELRSEDEKKIKKSGDELDENQRRELTKARISVAVFPVGKRPIGKIPFLSVDVKNKTKHMQVYLDWDYSSIEMFGRGNRVILSTPHMSRDLSQPQMMSAVNPERVGRFDINLARNYTRNSETGELQSPLPIADLADRVEQAGFTDPTSAEANVQYLYGLDVMLRFKRVVESDNKIISLLVPFAFEMKIEPDQPAFPPLRWLLRNYGRRQRSQEGSWLWGTQKKS